MHTELSRLRRFGISLAASLIGWVAGAVLYLAYWQVFLKTEQGADLLGPLWVFYLSAMFTLIGWLAIFVPIVLCLKLDNRLFTRGIAPVFAAFSSLSGFLIFLHWGIDFPIQLYALAHALIIGLVAGFCYSKFGDFPSSTKIESSQALVALIVLVAALAMVSLTAENNSSPQNVSKVEIILLRIDGDDDEFGVYSREDKELRDLLLPAEQLLLQQAFPKKRVISDIVKRVEMPGKTATAIVLLKEPPKEILSLPTPQNGTVLLWQSEKGFNFLPLEADVQSGKYYLITSTSTEGATQVSACEAESCGVELSFPGRDSEPK